MIDRATLWCSGLAAGLVLAGCVPREPAAVAPVPEAWGPERIEAVATFLRLEDQRDFEVEVFEAAAGAADPLVRTAAARAAGRIGSSEAPEFIRRLLGDPDSSVAASAAFAAGLLRDSAAVPSLIQLLDSVRVHQQPTVTIAALDALGRISTSEAREALSSFLAAASITDSDSLPLVHAALLAGRRAGDLPVATFARWLDSEDPEVRWRAVYALTRPPRVETVRLLLPKLNDPEPLVRAYTLRGLTAPVVAEAGVPPDSVLSLVMMLLDEPVYQVRIEAIRAVGSYPDPSAVAALIDILEGGTPHERLAVIEVLGALGAVASSAYPMIRALVLDSSQQVHLRATGVTSLARIDQNATRALLAGLRADPEWRVRAAVARATAELGVDALDDLPLLARDHDARVAAAAIRALVELFDPSAIARFRPLLVELLEAPDVSTRAAALAAFGRLADPTAFPLLLDAYETATADNQNDALLAAVDAIADLGRAGVLAPERAFFARFQRSDDYLVRLRVASRFGPAALSAWGEPLPIETNVTGAQYREIVERWVAPSTSTEATPRIRISTDEGEIELELFAAEAPLTVANFLLLARAGYFDGQEWPRVVPNFVVQGGDPRGDTSGGPGYTIRDELDRHPFLTGVLGMALSGPDTGGSQFFITHSPQPHLDAGYTVFGRLLEGSDVVERLLPGQEIHSIREIVEVEEHGNDR